VKRREALRFIFAERPEAAPSPELSDAETWASLDGDLEELDARGLAWSRLKRRGRSDRVPAEIAERLAKDHRANTVQAMRLTHAAREILDELGRRRVAAAPLKGTRLGLSSVLRDVGVRATYDVDLLVRGDDRGRAIAALSALGFTPMRGGESPKHLPPYRRGAICVELHTWAYWRADGSKVEVGAVLDHELEHALVHLVHHLFRSSITDPWLVVKTLSDVDELSRCPTLAMPRAERLADEAGLAEELEGLRSLARALAEGAELDDAAARVADACERRPRDELARAYLAHTFTRAPWWYRLETVAMTVRPSRAMMAERLGVDPDSRWIDLAYLARPFEIAWKGTSMLGRAAWSRAAWSRAAWSRAAWSRATRRR
jgi:hypothetical protein